MVDIENIIIDRLTDKLMSSFEGIRVYGEDVALPSKFPCVTIVEADNANYENTRDSGSNENHANLMYEVNVYSNNAHTKKSECKKILSVIDDFFLQHNFTRKSKVPQTINNSTVYRIIARYTALVSKHNVIYRR